MPAPDELAATQKTLILIELGESDDGPVGKNIDKLWTLFDEKYDESGDLRLQYLYVKRQAIDMLLGATWRRNLMSIGPGGRKEDLSQEAKDALGDMRKLVQQEIESGFEMGRVNLDIFESRGWGGGYF